MKTKFYLIPFFTLLLLLFSFKLSQATFLKEKPGLFFGSKNYSGATSFEFAHHKKTVSVPTTLYVNAQLTTGTNDGTSWENAYKGTGGLAEALKYAKLNAGVEYIFVAKGKYKPKYSPEDGRSFADSLALVSASKNHHQRSFLLVKDVKIYGGFDPANAIDDLTDQRILPGTVGEGSILSGDFKNNDGAITSNSQYSFTNNDENAGQVVISAGDVGSAVLDGFSITGGYARENVSITVNAKSVGKKNGGGMFSIGASPTIRNVHFYANKGTDGGAMYSSACTALKIYNTRFSGNTATGNAGAVYSTASTTAYTNVVFSGNSSTQQGGTIYNGSSSICQIVNSVFCGNKAGIPVGGAIMNAGTNTISNTIIWGNSSGVRGTATISNSIVQGGAEGSNNFDTDPLFENPVSNANAPCIGGNYHIKLTSVAINKGNNDLVPAYITTDIAGNTRIQAGKVDMGAYESEPQEIPLERLYINALLTTGDNSGKDWENAFYGPEAFAKALQYSRTHTSVKDIWVAKGTYYTSNRADTHSDTNPLDPNNTFVLVDGVKIYGGFAGTETDLLLRDWKTNKTILSGDQNKNNQADDGDAYQVVVSLNTGAETLLHGFTITGGYAAAAATTLEVDGITVNQYSGGGMYNDNASPTVEECIFYKNASRVYGGGMANWNNSSPFLKHTLFRENQAVSGAGMYNNGMEHEFTGVKFENNLATDLGGAVYNDRAFVSFTHSIFTANTAAKGGALASIAEPTDNTATGKYLGCLFVKNSATEKGGVYYYQNGAGDSPVFINSTFSKDTCASESGGNIIYFQTNAANELPKFYNCIMQKAGTGTFYSGSSATPNLFQAQYNLTDYELPDNTVIKNNVLSADFGFTDANSPTGDDGQYGTIDDGFIILSTSPAVNAGFNDFTPATLEKDLTGRQRIQNTRVDIGAYEYSTIIATLYVSQELVTGTNDGTSWENAYQGKGGLSEALHYATENQGVKNILVAKGTYVPTRRGDNQVKGDANDRNNTFVLVDGVKVYGGFTGREATIDERNWGENQTILSGEVGGSDYSDNCYHVVVGVNATSATQLDGFVITLGQAAGTGRIIVANRSVPNYYGGGLYNSNSSVILRNLVFAYNYSDKNGAGITNDNSFPSITNAVFYRNLADKFGGAIYNINSSRPIIAHTNFHKNYAGAIVNDSNSGITMANSILWENQSWESGTPVDIFDRQASGTSVTNSITQVYGTEGVNGIVKQDPKFVNAPSTTVATWMTTTDGLMLLPGSPAIDAGDNSLIPAGITKDIAGEKRIEGSHVDMGAYEFVNPCGNAVATVYVDSSHVAGGDGTSWETAFSTLHEAIDLANKCVIIQEILVAQGTYYPTALTNREVSLNINRANLKITGGYPSGGGERDHRKYLSILDGNIGDPGISTDNSGHIMTIVGLTGADSLVIDGLLFQNGRTIEAGGTITVNNVPVTKILGGALYIGKNSFDTPIAIRNCTFTNNYSEESGAAIYCAESKVTLHSCRFFSNESVDQAPGIYVYKGSMPITNTLFTKNVAGGQGGAITFNEATASSLINCTLFQNYTKGANAYGGAVNCYKSDLTVSNSIFNKNTYGGANTDSKRNASDIDPHDNSTLTISNSLMQVGSPYLNCPDCPDPGIDPQFIDVTSATKKGLGLLAGSVAINKANKVKLPSYVVNDLVGADRVRGVEADMGAFEAIPLTDPLERLYVREDQETGYNNGYGWDNAFYGSNGFARALEYARNNKSVKEIWVAKGTYYTFGRGDNHDSSNPLDPNNSFVLVDSLKIYGGFSGGEEDIAERDWKSNVTIVSGDQNKNSIADNGDAYQVLVSLNNSPETVLDGFTITGGYALRFSEDFKINGITVNQSSGAGLHNYNSSPTIHNCIFYKNTSRGTGGGMANWDNSKPDLFNVTFRQNKALTGGGMYYVLTGFYGIPVVHKMSNLLFDGNIAEGATGGEGGAVCNSRAFISFDKTVFVNNTAAKGGAVAAVSMVKNYYQHFETYTNCLFVNNTAIEEGGAYYFPADYEHGPVFTNSTFSRNVCQQETGGDVFSFPFLSQNREYPAFYNCILEKAENAHDFFSGGIYTSNSFILERSLINYPLAQYRIKENIVVTDIGLANSNLPAGADGEYGTADDGLIPLSTSKAINGGYNEYIPDDLASDFLGNKRIQGPFADIGAYEFNQACEATSTAIAKDGDVIEDIELSDGPVYLFEPDQCRVMGIFQAVNSELQNGKLNARTTIAATTPFHNKQPYVRRHYDLEPNVDSEEHEGYVTLYFTNTDFKNYNSWADGYKKLPVSDDDLAKNNLLIWQWHGSSTTHTPGAYVKNGTPSTGKYIKPDKDDIVWNEELQRWEIKFHFTGFSGFFVTTLEEGALPVTLTSFTVTPESVENGSVSALLKWSTTAESNSQSFEIVRSRDGKNWQIIGNVVAEGSSSIRKNYTYTDKNPVHGNNLYRLKMIDRDGSFAYSSIKNLYRKFNSIVYPNPVADWLYIDIEANQIVNKVAFFDIVGRKVGEQNYVPGTPVSVKELSPGIYFVELSGENGYLERQKIVVTRP